MQNAAIVLSLAALGGVVVASFPLRGPPHPPLWLAVGHGLVAATGVVLLAFAIFTSAAVPVVAQVALGLFVLAALGGATLLLGFHLRARALPITLVLAHGLAALTAVVLLWLSLV